MGRWVDLAAPNAVRPVESHITIPGPAPKYGSETRAILRSLGYTSEDIDSMIAQGIASEAWSEKYLPE
jgi:crotonobetainyl-CoA:carnitine CoA-transferase CaiB-like acyl-CoA transferase